MNESLCKIGVALLEVMECVNSWDCRVPVRIEFVVEESVEDLHNWLVDGVESFE